MNLLLLLDLLAFLGLLAFLRHRHVLGRIHGRLVDAVAIADAVTITVGLAALDLGPFTGVGLIAAASLPASLRKPVNGQKNHRSDNERAVFQ